MVKLIQKSGYIKAGGASGYMKYIATRERVEKLEGSGPATKAQEQFIESLLRDFPDAKELPEYEDYCAVPTSKTASVLISAALDANANTAFFCSCSPQFCSAAWILKADWGTDDELGCNHKDRVLQIIEKANFAGDAGNIVCSRFLYLFCIDGRAAFANVRFWRAGFLPWTMEPAGNDRTVSSAVLTCFCWCIFFGNRQWAN